MFLIHHSTTPTKANAMKDVMCPLCYIGKTNLETALEQFEHKAKVEIVVRFK